LPIGLAHLQLPYPNIFTPCPRLDDCGLPLPLEAPPHSGPFQQSLVGFGSTFHNDTSHPVPYFILLYLYLGAHASPDLADQTPPRTEAPARPASCQSRLTSGHNLSNGHNTRPSHHPRPRPRRAARPPEPSASSTLQSRGRSLAASHPSPLHARIRNSDFQGSSKPTFLASLRHGRQSFLTAKPARLPASQPASCSHIQACACVGATAHGMSLNQMRASLRARTEGV
jgi:hypothetical protein